MIYVCHAGRAEKKREQYMLIEILNSSCVLNRKLSSLTDPRVQTRFSRMCSSSIAIFSVSLDVVFDVCHTHQTHKAAWGQVVR